MLQARLRTGELREETLRLAARCGFGPAAEALGVPLVDPPEFPDALAHSIGGDPPAQVRDALLETLRPEWSPLL